MNLDKYKVKNAPDTVYYIPDFISEEEEKTLLSKVYNAPKTKWTVLSHRRLQNWGGLPGPKGMISEDLPQWLSGYAHKLSDLAVFQGNVPNHVLVNEYEPGQGIMPHEDGPAFYPTVSTISLGSHTVLDFYFHLNAGPSPRQQGQAAEPNMVHCATGSSHQVPGTSDSQCAEGGESGGDAKGQEEGHAQDDTSFDSRHFMSLLLQPRSLVLVQEDMYKVHLHGIKEVTEDVITEKIANLDLVPKIQLGEVLTRSTRVSLTIRYVPKVLRSKLIFGKR